MKYGPGNAFAFSDYDGRRCGKGSVGDESELLQLGGMFGGETLIPCLTRTRMRDARIGGRLIDHEGRLGFVLGGRTASAARTLVVYEGRGVTVYGT